uniref:Uncharacterized protein n=1 Tax=Anguilla anguilla TaxID=7936 RepID=A0A0E9QIV0_ANGAN
MCAVPVCVCVCLCVCLMGAVGKFSVDQSLCSSDEAGNKGKSEKK